MKNGFYYQVLINLSREKENFTYGKFLRDLLFKGNLENVEEFMNNLEEEVVNTPLHEMKGPAFFSFLSEQALLFCLYRYDFERFETLSNIINSRFETIAGDSTGFSKSNWASYFGYLNSAARRLRRVESIETLEGMIDEIEWTDYDQEFIYRISGLMGFIYLHETEKSKYNKSRFWIQKAATESREHRGLVYHLDQASFHLDEVSTDSITRLERIIENIEQELEGIGNPQVKKLYNAAAFQLQSMALLHKLESYDDDELKSSDSLDSLKDLEFQIKKEATDNEYPRFITAIIHATLAKRYALLAESEVDTKASVLLAMANDNAASAMRDAERIHDTALGKYVQLLRTELLAGKDKSIEERDIRDLIAEFKKSPNTPNYIWATQILAKFYHRKGENKKAYEALLDLHKTGLKRLESDGLELITSGFKMMMPVFEEEIVAPGISWIVDEMEPFFVIQMEIINGLGEHLDHIGQCLFDRYREVYLSFSPASQFNIKTYLRYQLYEMKLMQLNSQLNNDRASIRMMDQLITNITNENNPLSFIQADWEEFRLVPNDVRNKVVNKCISITKGDLPASAEHLDFSYRNLRSYITFNEVNRLGFFLNERKTKNRQLEEGIRLIFHDLYKKGTIFEVVFDMPKFLVEFANDGFASQDLEEALSIKGTTAKKYIKIMMEVELIGHEKSIGRKHFYKLRKDNVMNRLAKKQKVLIG